MQTDRRVGFFGKVVAAQLAVALLLVAGSCIRDHSAQLDELRARVELLETQAQLTNARRDKLAVALLTHVQDVETTCAMLPAVKRQIRQIAIASRSGWRAADRLIADGALDFVLWRESQ